MNCFGCTWSSYHTTNLAFYVRQPSISNNSEKSPIFILIRQLKMLFEGQKIAYDGQISVCFLHSPDKITGNYICIITCISIRCVKCEPCKLYKRRPNSLPYQLSWHHTAEVVEWNWKLYVATPSLLLPTFSEFWLLLSFFVPLRVNQLLRGEGVAEDNSVHAKPHGAHRKKRGRPYRYIRKYVSIWW